MRVTKRTVHRLVASTKVTKYTGFAGYFLAFASSTYVSFLMQSFVLNHSYRFVVATLQPTFQP